MSGRTDALVRLQIEHRVDGFVAEKLAFGSERLPSGVGLVSASAIIATFPLLALRPSQGVCLLLGVGALAMAGLAVVAVFRTLRPAFSTLQVVVERPRVRCRVDGRVSTALLVGADVDLGSESIDVAAVEGAVLRIPRSGLTEHEVEVLVELLRAAAGRDTGSAAQVPEALRVFAERGG